MKEVEVRRRRGRPTSNINDLSWEDAICTVLRDAGSAMRYTDIAEQISNRRLKSVANPAASVAVTFSRSLADPEASPFVRIGQGEYTLKELIEAQSVSVPDPASAVVQSETGALRAFGMFWVRDLVIWNGRPKILGRQSDGASDVDFADQVGVYLLHDRDRVVYVGRAGDALAARLKAHTTDRLSGRWDRFSWFGLRAVTEDGLLSEPSAAWNHTVVIETLEALLIESLEPPLNRRRGDNFSGVEYLQVGDPEIENRKMKRLFEELLRQRSA